MIFTTKIKVTKYTTKNFKNKKGETISYLSAEFVDENYDKFTASVPASAKDQIALVLDSDSEGEVDGVGTFLVIAGERGPRFTLIEFKAE